MTESQKNVFSKSPLALFLRIRDRYDAKQRLKHGLVAGLCMGGLGIGAAFAEPGLLHEPAITVVDTKTNQDTMVISEGDRVGAVAILGGFGLAGVAGYGLIQVKRAEEVLDEERH